MVYLNILQKIQTISGEKSSSMEEELAAIY